MEYLQMKSPEAKVQNQNNFTGVVLMLSSTKIDQKVNAWLNNTATRAKNRNIIKISQANTSSTHVPGLR